MNTIFVKPDKQEKYYLPHECINLFFQVTICCLQFIFNGSRGDCSVWISIEVNWWIRYHIGTCTFLEHELTGNVEFHIFTFATNDTPHIVHNNMPNPVENVFSGI